jgi:hypothetical protein
MTTGFFLYAACANFTISEFIRARLAAAEYSKVSQTKPFFLHFLFASRCYFSTLRSNIILLQRVVDYKNSDSTVLPFMNFATE